MKKGLIYILFLLPHFCDAQSNMIFDTVLVNNTIVYPFSVDKDLQRLKISFREKWPDHITAFVSRVNGAPQPDSPVYYNLRFLGDKYFFEKKYGLLQLPEEAIESVINRKCGIPYYLTLTVSRDSIKINMESYCPVKDDENSIFTKVEIMGGYSAGKKKFEERIQSVLDKQYFPNEVALADSAYLFTIAVARKDSCVMSAKLDRGTPSLFTSIITKELLKVCSWHPYITGGIPVNSYRKIFVQLHKNKKVTVDYPD